MAGGSCIRLFTTFALQAESFGLVEASLGEGHVVAKPVRKQFIAQLAEIVAPADLFSDSGGVTRVGRVHQLEIFFFLCGGTRGGPVGTRHPQPTRPCRTY